MNKIYNWKRRILKETTEIFEEGKPLGVIRKNPWRERASASMYGHKYKFISRGQLKPKTVVYDEENEQELARIEYSTWCDKATIRYKGNEYEWKFNNLWLTKWSLSRDGEVVAGSVSETKGNLQASTADDVLILSGIFLTNQVTEITLIGVIAALIPVWIVVLM